MMGVSQRVFPRAKINIYFASTTAICLLVQNGIPSAYFPLIHFFPLECPLSSSAMWLMIPFRNQAVFFLLVVPAHSGGFSYPPKQSNIDITAPPVVGRPTFADLARLVSPSAVSLN